MVKSETILTKLTYRAPTQDLLNHDMPSKYRVQDTTLRFISPQFPLLVERNGSDEEEASINTSKSDENKKYIVVTPTTPGGKLVTCAPPSVT
jgi:hypothetical protein